MGVVRWKHRLDVKALSPRPSSVGIGNCIQPVSCCNSCAEGEYEFLILV